METGYDALSFSWAGDKFIGRPYSEMDCQKFYEKCAAEVGLIMDLKGSNAWFRKFRETGWTGSPEECKDKFGSIPKGATLFIHAFDGGEVKRGYHDGLGNASHIGIKTGRGKGAIHSSESKGCVAESDFRDKTIRGGWNMVGLSRLFDYGKKINMILRSEDPEKKEDEPMEQKAKVWSLNGGPVKMRQQPNDSCSLYVELPFGTEVKVLQQGETWTKISAASREGWYMKTIFLIFGEVIPEDPGTGDDMSGQTITITLPRSKASGIIDALEFISDMIAGQIGERG